MSDELPAHTSHEPHPWIDLTPDEVLDTLIHELYPPVSAIGGEVDRLASGAFEDDELISLLDQMRESVNILSRLVVMLKRYTDERHSATENSALLFPQDTPPESAVDESLSP
jgi:hypothetical protein